MALPDLSLSLQFGDVAHADRHRAALPRHKVIRWIRHALDVSGEITVRIVDEEEGRQLNRDYRQKDYATNVLTFDYAAEPMVMADLVLCAPVVAREAREMRRPLEAHYAHLLVHGALHAQGWDHETSEADADEMEAHETAIMTGMGYPDPYRQAGSVKAKVETKGTKTAPKKTPAKKAPAKKAANQPATKKARKA